jgi:hypothetical protein
MTNEEIFKIVEPYTICSKERVYSTINAVRHVVENGIEGDIIECGVYKGGQTMGMMIALSSLGEERDVYLYDTFEGMPAPEDWETKNGSKSDTMALDFFNAFKLEGNSSDWCRCMLHEVEENIKLINYNHNRVYYVKGMVEDTLPSNKHKSIAVLRLDTDWYSSTKAELEILYPKISSGGVLILDDYGHWNGAKKAVDEYIKNNNLDIELIVDDGTGRTVFKP